MGTHQKRIWIITAGVDSDHEQAAQSVEEALRAASPESHVRLIDLMTVMPRWFGQLYHRAYGILTSRPANLFGRLYDATDKPPRPGREGLERIRVTIESSVCRTLGRELPVERPDWVVHTHPVGPAALGEWIQASRLVTRQAVVVSGIYPHRIWLSPAVHLWFVAADATREHLIGRGAGANSIEVSGIPISARHRLPVDPDAVVRDFDWPVDRPVILFLCRSNQPAGAVDAAIGGLLQAFPDVMLQVVCTHQGDLFRRASARLSRYSNLRVTGSTDRIHELLDCATAVIGPTSGITAAECLAHGSALVGFSTLPGPRDRDTDYLVAAGAALRARTTADLVTSVRSLLSDTNRASLLRASAATMGRPDAAFRIAERILA